MALILLVCSNWKDFSRKASFIFFNHLFAKIFVCEIVKYVFILSYIDRCCHCVGIKSIWHSAFYFQARKRAEVPGLEFSDDSTSKDGE